MEDKIIEQDFGDLAINMGPQHPSTHGVFRLKLHLQGERINKVESYLGYLHRGVEKLTEVLDYDMIPPVLERDDYLSPTSNSLGFVNIVEKMCSIEVPRRASYIRVLGAELQRISSHLVALGTYGLDLGGALGGGASLFLYCFREREKILDIMEELTGTRFHTNLNQIGGVRYDVKPELVDKIHDLISYLRPLLLEYSNMFSKDEIIIKRTRNIGVISQKLAKENGCSGPVARASGINFDIRKNKPYECYNEFDFDIPLGETGDAYDRTLVRIKENIESLKIVEQIIEGIPTGDLCSRKPLKSAKLIKPPKGSFYSSVESPSGELGFFVVSDGTSIPYRMKIRAPSFSNLSVIEKILPGNYVADSVAILGSLDPVFGDVDR
ncbi:MAG: NADH-quinone oxidoreductase subunit D [Thermodesulfobacteriota bacterium]|nr:NADH-quinone oxidoreductase subunit D [Thermodesulfobacteriota bacterium]